jgi:hypothetical protein
MQSGEGAWVNCKAVNAAEIIISRDRSWFVLPTLCVRRGLCVFSSFVGRKGWGIHITCCANGYQIFFKCLTSIDGGGDALLGLEADQVKAHEAL